MLRLGVVAAVFQVVCARDILSLAFLRGRFTAGDIEAAVPVLLAYGVATPVFVVWPLVLRVAQTLPNFVGIFPIIGLGLLGALVAGRLLMGPLGIAGAVWATLVGHLVLVGGGLGLLARQELVLLVRHEAIRLAGFSAITAGCAWGLASLTGALPHPILRLAVIGAGLAGLTVVAHRQATGRLQVVTP
jgi:peptidoglycan biosynthesis protein MviN/MurJ (putative lipid II flippase)